MDIDIRERSAIFVLFGAGGDLSWRLIVPALFNLYLNRRLSEPFLLLGADRQDFTDASLSDHYRKGVAEHSRSGAPGNGAWEEFARKIRYHKIDLADEAGFAQLRDRLDALEKDWRIRAERLFYMATPPSLFEPIAVGLGSVGLAKDRERARIVMEKPLGHDLESFRRINGALTRFFTESQIFQIDHSLGKETVQNILALRFANPMFEPIWNRRYIDHVAISIPETLGVERRGGYYEKAGALRDMVQNHLFQLLSLVAMEPPIALGANDIRDKKLDVLRSLRPIPGDAVNVLSVRGQYGRGRINGVPAAAYREEPGVDPRSNTETYAALKLHVDNWRWQDVPFYLRTGKRMASSLWEISICFRNAPHQTFPASVGLNAEPGAW